MGPQNKDRAKTTPAIMCVKILLHIFNFIYLVIGVSVLAIGIWTQVQLKDLMELTQLYYDNAAYIMIGVGVLIFLVALGGFYCTAKDKVAPLYMYAIFISLLAILQVGAGIAGGIFANKLDSKFVTGLENSIENTSDNMDAWNTVQQTLKCCGVNNYTDWETMGKKPVPASCFSQNKTDALPSHSTVAPAAPTTKPASSQTTVTTTNPTTAITAPTTHPFTNVTEPSTTHGNVPETTSATVLLDGGSRKKRSVVSDKESNHVFPKGCHQMISDTITGYLAVIVGVCIGFVALQVLGAVLACCLAKKTSKNNYEQIY